MIAYKTNQFTRITKQAALKAYLSGKTIHLCGSKMRPGGPWNPQCPININDYAKSHPDTEIVSEFNNRSNNYRQYNCSYEQGYYVSYYLREGN